MSRDHALLSPSSANIWLNCPASARAGEHVEDPGNVFADEGSLFHRLCELHGFYRFRYKEVSDLKKFTQEREECQNNELYDAVMGEHITDYLDWIQGKYEAYRDTSIDVEYHLETKVCLEPFVPGGFGTCDFDFIADEIIEVIDLKYGQSPAGRIYGDDPQLTLYALGAYLRAKKENPYHVTEIIRRTVYQPRLKHIHTVDMTLKELLAWAEEIKPKALEAWQGTDRYVPGDHCRWCKVAGTCKALASVNLRHAQMTDPAQMTPEEVSAALHAARQIKAWAKSVEDFAFNTAKSGKIIPGWKIVEGSGKRKILRVAEAIDRLRMHTDDGPKYLEPLTLLGITALEKNFGKKGLAAILGDLIERPPGAPKLVPDSDARPVKGSVESDFAGEQWNHLEINEDDLPF